MFRTRCGCSKFMDIPYVQEYLKLPLKLPFDANLFNEKEVTIETREFMIDRITIVQGEKIALYKEV